MTTKPPVNFRAAQFSACRNYRYALWRGWAERVEPPQAGAYAMFVGLNPSTADETLDDPTIRRCVGFAQDWGYQGLCMVNLFAWRATQPADMLAQNDPVGPENDAVLLELAANAGIVVAAWGVHGTHVSRDEAVKRLLPRLHYLLLTKAGHPGHPLYLPSSLKPMPYKT